MTRRPGLSRPLQTLLIVLLAASCVTQPKNRPPTAAFIVTPLEGDIDTLYIFDAGASTDPDEDSRYLRIRWDWDGDGVWDTIWGAGKKKTHRYGTPGFYTVGLQVRDSWGEIGFCVSSVLVGKALHHPVASLQVTPSVGTVDSLFTFDASASIPTVGELESLKYRWDWEGDGAWDMDWTAGAVRTHQYSRAGVYPAAVEIRNIEAFTDTAVFDVSVFGPGDMPIATFTVTPTSGSIVTDFIFDASGCSDVQDPPEDLQIRWDWTADGLWETDWTTQKTAVHRFNEEGDIHVLLAVRDTYGFIVTTERIVTVTNTPPIAALMVTPPNGHVATVFTFNASGSSDAEEPTTDLKVRWDWEGDGVWDTTPNTIMIVEMVFPVAGSRSVILQVSDILGAADTTSVHLLITNTTPFPAFTIAPSLGTMATDFEFDASSSSDAETPDNLEFRWDWNSDGVFDVPWTSQSTASHRFSALGGHSITLEVRDPQGLTAQYADSLVVMNGPPVAVVVVDDPYSTVSQPVVLQGSGSFDLEDDFSALDFRWDVDSDGEWESDWSKTADFSYLYTIAGVYSATLEVRDSEGLSSSGTTQVFVAPDPLWQAPLPAILVRGSPALSHLEDRIYIVGETDNAVMAYARDGTYLWTYPIDAGISSSPVVGIDGTILIAAVSDSLYAISPEGDRLWARACPEHKYSTPAIGNDGAIYLTDGEWLRAVESNGSTRWSCSLPLTSNWGSPAIGPDGTIYVPAGYGICAVSPAGVVIWHRTISGYSESSVTIGLNGMLYYGTQDYLVAIDPMGSEMWRYPGTWHGGRFAVGQGGRLYAAGGSLVALDVSGNVVWSLPNLNCGGTPTIGVDGTIYVSSSVKYLNAIDAAGHLRWKARLLEFENPIFGSPVITSDGSLYLPVSGIVFAFLTDSLGLADVPWPRFMANNQNTGHR
jgi:hypothetical protein